MSVRAPFKKGMKLRPLSSPKPNGAAWQRMPGGLMGCHAALSDRSGRRQGAQTSGDLAPPRQQCLSTPTARRAPATMDATKGTGNKGPGKNSPQNARAKQSKKRIRRQQLHAVRTAVKPIGGDEGEGGPSPATAGSISASQPQQGDHNKSIDEQRMTELPCRKIDTIWCGMCDEGLRKGTDR